MSLILASSIVILLAALGWSVFLLIRLRDWRIGFLTGMIFLMALRQSLTLLKTPEFWPVSFTADIDELPGLAVSILAFLALLFLERMIRQRDQHASNFEAEIAERERAEESLRRSEEHLRAIFDSVVVGIITIDEGGLIQWFNPGAERMFGYTPDEVMGGNVAMLMPEPDRSRHDTYIANYLRSGQAKIIRVGREVHGLRRDGSTFPMELEIGEMVVGGRRMFAGIARDITKRKEAEAQLVQASKLATLGEMASGIAHELNQPLSVVGMAAELSLMSMEKGEFDSEFVRKKLETIAGQKERMAEIINHMRLFSRKDEADLESFNPLESVSGAVGFIDEQFRASGIELKEDLPAACRAVSGFPLRLEQVVLNLLTNARDAVLGRRDSGASPAGAETPKVRVSLVDDKRRKTVVISVADNGGGIPQPALGRVFDPFFTTKTAGEGTGLGLSISYSIIDAMGGRLEAENICGGARFQITLPVSRDAPGADAKPPRENRRKSRIARPASALPRVLFVDDEEAIVEEVAEYLGRKGYDVATAGNGWEALERHRSRPADMVITDWLMPGMGGDELIRRLRRTHPDLPILVITGHTTFGEDQDIVAHGTSAVLKKPIDLRELLQRVQQMTRP